VTVAMLLISKNMITNQLAVVHLHFCTGNG